MGADWGLTGQLWFRLTESDREPGAARMGGGPRRSRAFTPSLRRTVRKTWAKSLKSGPNVPNRLGMSAPAFAPHRAIRAASTNSRADAKRAWLLAATRRMTVVLMASFPTLIVATFVLVVFRASAWSPLVFAVICAGTVAAGAVSAELWRRLGALSDLAALNEELRYRATHDLLMHVPNRELLETELIGALDASQGIPGAVGLFFLDLDRFKFVNDTLGHAAGDELLKAVGRRIERAIADEDAVLARVGGDELVVLMRRLESDDHLAQVADRLLAKFADPFMIDNVKLNIGVSIGMAVSVVGETAGDLYRHADAALYEAKERGRGQAVLADKDMRAQRDLRVRTELALRSALADRDIEAWFQPEVDLITGEVVAAEALARWRTADGVEIASSFIDVARRAGMLEDLMIEMAGQVWEWRQSSGATIPVALNVSAVHLPVLLALHEEAPHARPFEGMRLEIAETDIIHDFDDARRDMNRVRALGAQVMLDDFGAGYSSLQMLSDLPIDGIKIDRSYTVRIETDGRVRNLVTSIAEFARTTEMIVVAEGIETPTQARFLTSIGIDRGQGFLFSSALDPRAFNAMLQAESIGTSLSQF